MQSRYLTVHQLSERWCVSRRTLQRWRQQYYGPNYIKMGNRILYPIAIIESYERVHEHLNTSELVHRRFSSPTGRCH